MCQEKVPIFRLNGWSIVIWPFLRCECPTWQAILLEAQDKGKEKGEKGNGKGKGKGARAPVAIPRVLRLCPISSGRRICAYNSFA